MKKTQASNLHTMGEHKPHAPKELKNHMKVTPIHVPDQPQPTKVNAFARLKVMAANDNGDAERIKQLQTQIRDFEIDVKEIEDDGDDATVERKHLEKLRDELRRLKDKTTAGVKRPGVKRPGVKQTKDVGQSLKRLEDRLSKVRIDLRNAQKELQKSTGKGNSDLKEKIQMFKYELEDLPSKIGKLRRIKDKK